MHYIVTLEENPIPLLSVRMEYLHKGGPHLRLPFKKYKFPIIKLDIEDEKGISISFHRKTLTDIVFQTISQKKITVNYQVLLLDTKVFSTSIHTPMIQLFWADFLLTPEIMAPITLELRFPHYKSNLLTALEDISPKRETFLYKADSYQQLTQRPLFLGNFSTNGFLHKKDPIHFNGELKKEYFQHIPSIGKKIILLEKTKTYEGYWLSPETLYLRSPLISPYQLQRLLLQSCVKNSWFGPGYAESCTLFISPPKNLTQILTEKINFFLMRPLKNFYSLYEIYLYNNQTYSFPGIAINIYLFEKNISWKQFFSSLKTHSLKKSIEVFFSTKEKEKIEDLLESHILLDLTCHFKKIGLEVFYKKNTPYIRKIKIIDKKQFENFCQWMKA